MKQEFSFWNTEAIFYHLYPLGLCGAPEQNDFSTAPEPRLEAVHAWVDHIAELGCTAVYLGPVFESGSHGYDTADYLTVDRRLGTNENLKAVIAHFHSKGVKVVLDAVFNHVGRHFYAFRDLMQYGESSVYRHWFSGVNFGLRSPKGDNFTYETWNGHYELVKLNLQQAEVKAHIFKAVQQWVEEFGIDGLRLDAADVMDTDFLQELSGFCHRLRPDFWLLGEVIHGDYRKWANPQMLDSVTNYECYKGLYSSHNDRNYFEIAWSLNRQFGSQGIYKHLQLYSFADNHDVNRIGSTLQNPAHLYPLHALLYTMPGIPSIYYGSEWGIPGTKLPHTDAPLRPALPAPDQVHPKQHPDLAEVIRNFARIRKTHRALQHGAYEQVHVAQEQLAFMRCTAQETILVAVNAADTPVELMLKVALADESKLVNLLDPSQAFTVKEAKVQLPVPSNWVSILLVV